MKIKILFFVLFIFSQNVFSQNIEVNGKVSDQFGKPISEVSVLTIDNKYHSITNSSGIYNITIPNTYKKIVFNKVGAEIVVKYLKIGEVKQVINVELIADADIEAVSVSGLSLNSTGIISVDAKIADRIPSINDGIEALIKTQLGVVGSRNEMSSQYSVRGGNFDENLVYVNGIEIYRPQLIRSGEQEGLSFVNPMMVSSINFSAGGFSAKYGDKMSSVLDIKYKQPTEFGAAFSVSLLGASGYVQTASKDKRFRFISGLRYKSTKYMLNSLETSGEYNPSFIDFQSFLVYDISKTLDISLLGNFSDNNFNFIPESRRTNFGTINRAYGLYVAFNGQEIDRFYSYTSALTLNYHPTKNTNYAFILSGFRASESENFDIESGYSLNELNRDFSSDNAGDSTLNLGNGYFIKHARNALYIDVLSAQLKATHKKHNNTIHWGLKYKVESINDEIDEWEMLDSAGYSIPYNGENLILYKNIKAENYVLNNRFEAYFQNTALFNGLDGDFQLNTGLRASYNSYNDEILISPRISGAYKPASHSSTIYRFSSGVYNQPSFYKEMRLFDGTLVEQSKAQKSIHFVLGNDFQFMALGRKLLLKTEVYYKILQNIIPFELNNVRVKYYANQRANGYVAGIDTKISGEFVPGVDSWFSLSVMKTQEDVYDIGNGEDDGLGYLPRPTDQRVNASLFLQDYLPGNKMFKAHLNLIYGTGFTFWPPETSRETVIFRSPDYKRVDLGMSAVLLSEQKTSEKKVFKNIKSIWVTVEVLNLLKVDNTISYTWLTVVPNTTDPTISVYDSYAVPNHLTSRRFNIKLSVKF